MYLCRRKKKAATRTWEEPEVSLMKPRKWLKRVDVKRMTTPDTNDQSRQNWRMTQVTWKNR
jgi:hypothetical protein